MLTSTTLAAFLSSIALTAAYPPPKTYQWITSQTASTQQFRGLSPVSDDIVWVSGTNGTVLRTVNGGSSWDNVSPMFLPSENSSDYQFRDIQAWSARDAVVLSIGEGNASRIYRTENGGHSWTQTFINQDEKAFYDCMAFEKEEGKEGHGLTMGDPVDGKFQLLETWDGGATWTLLSGSSLPDALEGEFGFAASGTCVEVAAGRWYIATGGVDPGRVIYTDDIEQGWDVSNSSIDGGAAAGVYSVRFRDAKNGIAVGGDYEVPDANVNIAALSNDGGESWTKSSTFPGGYRSGASWVPGCEDIALAVGTTGSDITLDGGKTWNHIDNGTFDAVECVTENTCWASGSKGRVAKLEL